MGEPILELQNVSGKAFRNVSLSVRKGEIVAFTGLQGSGASEVLQCILVSCLRFPALCLWTAKPSRATLSIRP